MINRRQILQVLTATGIGTPVLHRSIVSLMQDDGVITSTILKQAEWVTDFELTDSERDEIVGSVRRTSQGLRSLRKQSLSANTAPAIHFQTLAGHNSHSVHINRSISLTESAVGTLPDSPEKIAFLPVTELAGFIRTRKLSSLELTKIYLERLKKYSPMLRCVVNLTEDLAIKQAKRADVEIAAGKYRGPLHGIPWGAKDLISVPGYPTTWGIPHLKDQMLEERATVVQRLEEAGAVLVAKLSLGALAMGDKWFGGKTRNPWNPRTGSSGSSAGSASSTVAGLVGFSLGSETLGSITSPSKVCGASGFRPTYGRVSRYGCMPLSWSMDKIGPICRSIEDCALVFAAIHGADGLDATVSDREFQWPGKPKFSGLKVGYQKSRRETKDRKVLAILKDLGCELIEVNPPSFNDQRVLTTIIDVEGATVFDEMLRGGHTEGWNSWPGTFRAAQYISAIDYLRIQRHRTKLMHEFEEFISQVDVLVDVQEIYHTNLAGHPSVVLPYGYRETRQGAKRPINVTLTGHLNADDQLLSIAHAVQNQVQAHLEHPPLDDWLSKYDAGELDNKPAPVKSDDK